MRNEFDEYENTPIEYYLVGYGHEEILDIYDRKFNSFNDAVKYARSERLSEIEYQMELHNESREEAKQDTFYFYIGEKRKGYTELWLKEINPITGRLTNTDL